MPVALFEFALIVVVLMVFGTQVIWPIYRGTPMFPVIQREATLRNELAKVKQAQIERELEEAIKREQTTLSEEKNK
jgi:hypothetical protein